MTTFRLKDVAHINRRVLPESTDPDYRFRYVDIAAVDDLGRVSIPQDEFTFGTAPSRARRLAPAGSVLVSTVRTYLRAIATVPEDPVNLVHSTGFAVLEAKSCIDARYLAYYCRSSRFVDSVVAKSVGVSYPAISPTELACIPVALPELDQQRRIADFLDAETTQIDCLLATRERQRMLLRERAYSLVSETLLPGVLERRLGKAPWPWLPAMLPSRPLVRLGYVCRLQNGITIDGGRDLSGDLVTRPYLRVANVQAGHVRLDSVVEVTVPRSMAASSTLQRGDVLMTEGGDLDKLGRGTVWRDELPGCLHQNHVFALRPEPGSLDPDYLALMTQTIHGRCYFESTGTRTTNLASTNSSKILSFPIPLPAPSTQQALVLEVRQGFDVLTRAGAKLDAQAQLLRERRQALITAAVTGEFDVTAASGRGIGV